MSGADPSGFPTFRDATARIGGLRIMIAFLQGIVAWLLLRLVAPSNYVPGAPVAPVTAHWASQHPMPLAALALLTSLLPVIAVVEVSRMRTRTLLTYIGVTALALVGLAVYDIWREPLSFLGTATAVRVWPSFQLSACAVLGLFIVNQLLEHHERGYGFFDHYGQHFEDSWKRGFQLVLALIFSGLAWGVLNLGSLLFLLLHIEWPGHLLEHNWFRCPFIAMAFAAALHITDVRPALLMGMRNAMTLLSWLLLLVVLLCGGFVVALCFVGVTPLWETRRAASILLTCCALTVFLLNAAYKDGDPASLPAGVMRLVGRVAGPVLVPLAALALYAIALRVRQHGWTPERVWSIAIALMALIYTCGYTFAALDRRGWLKPLEAVNVGASFVILGILVLLLTPLADPARLSVDSQLSRLEHGKVSAEAFDYQFLRFDSATYGRSALARLVKGSNVEARERAARMQASVTRQYFGQVPDASVTETAFSHARIYPQGAQLPPGFRETNWSSAVNPDCLRNGAGCELYVVTYGPGGEVAVIVHPTPPRGSRFSNDEARVYQRNAANHWLNTGYFDHIGCPSVLAALQDGKAQSTAPLHDDLLVAGIRLRFTAINSAPDRECEQPASRAPAQNRPPEAQAPPHMGPAFGKPAGQ